MEIVSFTVPNELFDECEELSKKYKLNPDDWARDALMDMAGREARFNIQIDKDALVLLKTIAQSQGLSFEAWARKNIAQRVREIKGKAMTDGVAVDDVLS